MKKSLLVLILAAAMVVPAFAQKGDMSINGKFGVSISNNFNMSSDSMPYSIDAGYKMENSASIGAEFFYELIDGLSVGAGINYTFPFVPKVEQASVYIKNTNFYLAVKPEAKIDSGIFSSVYLIGQIGGSSITMGSGDETETADMGIYLGFGAGTIIKDCFIVELVLSSSNGSLTTNGQSGDLEYTATTINVGYKFAL